MRRNLLPGTRNPLSCPLSKQRMMVCCETLQIFAASPVVNTVFIRASTWPAQPARMGEIRARPNDRAGLRTEIPSVTHAGQQAAPPLRTAVKRLRRTAQEGEGGRTARSEGLRVVVQDGELRPLHHIIPGASVRSMTRNPPNRVVL